MIRIDEEALICDLAETYQIYDYKLMPPSQVAIFVKGLKDDSRIKMKMVGLPVSPQMILQAAIVDRLGLLVWQRSADGQKNINRPKSVLEKLLNTEVENDVTVFESGEDFEQARLRLINQSKGGS